MHPGPRFLNFKNFAICRPCEYLHPCFVLIHPCHFSVFVSHWAKMFRFNSRWKWLFAAGFSNIYRDSDPIKLINESRLYWHCVNPIYTSESLQSLFILCKHEYVNFDKNLIPDLSSALICLFFMNSRHTVWNFKPLYNKVRSLWSPFPCHWNRSSLKSVQVAKKSLFEFVDQRPKRLLIEVLRYNASSEIFNTDLVEDT